MTDGFPRSVRDLATWAVSNGIPIEEARRRFAQYVVLCGIAGIRPLQRSLVFKGGNALDFIWQPNRSTIDLDFSLDMVEGVFPAGIDTIRTLMDRACTRAGRRFGVAFAVHSVRQQPPGDDKTFVTYTSRIGYALADETRLLVRMANNQSSPHVIPVEISINEPICGSTLVTIDERSDPLRVSTTEDIVAEKLRALLQQPIRRRTRPQDLLDIAVIVRGNPGLNRDLVGTYLTVKAAARDVPVSRDAFRHQDVLARAAVGYDELAATTRSIFIPFDEALATLRDFVDELPILDE